MTTHPFNPTHNAGAHHNPFTVPEGYFATFSQRLMTRIAQESPLKARRPTVIELPIVRWIPAVGVACVALLALCFTHWMPTTSQQPTAAMPSAATVQSDPATDSYADAAYDYYVLPNAQTLATYDADF